MKIKKQKAERTDAQKATQTGVLIALAKQAELFRNADGTGFADLTIGDHRENDGHRETWPLRSKKFHAWIRFKFFKLTGGAPDSEALKKALETLEAQAEFDARERAVHLRVGSGSKDSLYLDLCDDAWRAIRIDDSGWKVIPKPNVRFRRTKGMRPLPVPGPGGSIDLLRPYLNLKNDADFVLVVSWLLAALRPCGPYPLMVVTGEQGSAKSTFAAILRSLVDPNKVPLRPLPGSDRDLFVATGNAHLLCFDNLSHLSSEVSDSLSRLATRGGFSTRQNYTDEDEMMFDGAKPVLLNGITDLVNRADLADRAIFITLGPISEQHRRTEEELWAAFEKERPFILGALLDAMVEGLQRLPETRLDKHPRMADFARWATACEIAFWPAGTFREAYDSNRAEAVETNLEGDPVASAIRKLMSVLKNPPWEGNATELLHALGGVVEETLVKSRSWPGNPRALSGRLRRAASFLRHVGIEIGFERAARGRIITITKKNAQEQPSREQRVISLDMARKRKGA